MFRFVCVLVIFLFLTDRRSDKHWHLSSISVQKGWNAWGHYDVMTSTYRSPGKSASYRTWVRVLLYKVLYYSGYQTVLSRDTVTHNKILQKPNIAKLFEYKLLHTYRITHNLLILQYLPINVYNYILFFNNCHNNFLYRIKKYTSLFG